MPQDELLRQKIANLKTLWDQLTEKLNGLQQDKILETRSDEKLRLGRLIDETEKERDEVEQKMAYLEGRLREVMESDQGGGVARNNHPTTEDIPVDPVMTDNLKVFISYSHDSPEHKNRVLDLADRLHTDGIDCRIDQYVAAPPEGWPSWMLDQIEQVDFVLLVCTPIYGERVRGRGEAGKGKGAKWEGAIITQVLYDGEAHNTKFIPVLFSPTDTDCIPVFLRGVNYYVVDTDPGYETLYRRLTGQHDTPKPTLGKRRSLPPRPRKFGLNP